MQVSKLANIGTATCGHRPRVDGSLNLRSLSSKEWQRRKEIRRMKKWRDTIVGMERLEDVKGMNKAWNEQAASSSKDGRNGKITHFE
jgi:hypothetical protein